MRCGGGPATTHSTSPSARPRPLAISCASVWLRAPIPSTAHRLPLRASVLGTLSLRATRFWASAWAIDARTLRGLPSRRSFTQGTHVP